MTYFYPEITGYSWNMLQRITNEMGIAPLGSGNTSGQTYVDFATPLTDPQKAQLDAIMASNPGYPPANANRGTYSLKDIWETRLEFAGNVGGATPLPFRIYYNESVQGSGVFDRIELHFLKALTGGERAKVLSEHSALLTLLHN